MKLYVVRHGETDWNVLHILQGWHDIPLNENGIRQAYETKEKMKDVQIDVVISSPLSRSYETARIITEGRNLPILVDDRFRERAFGKYEGASYIPDGARKAMQVEDAPDFDGETLRDLTDRVYGALDDLKSRYSDKSVLLATHGGTIRAINAYFSGLETVEKLSYGSIARNGEVLVYETE